MAFQKRLSDEEEQRLLVDAEDGWFVHELSVMYKVSLRTVYRILAKNGVRADVKGRRRTRKRYRWEDKKPKELQPCGTNAAYQRHRRKGEYPCSECLEAHAENVKKAKQKGSK